MTYRIDFGVIVLQRNDAGQVHGSTHLVGGLEIEPGVLASLADLLDRLAKVLRPTVGE